MKKYLGLLGAMGLAITSTLAVVSCGQTLQFSLITNLSSAQNNLGEVVVKDLSLPTDEEIFTAFLNKNAIFKDLTIDELTFELTYEDFEQTKVNGAIMNFVGKQKFFGLAELAFRPVLNLDLNQIIVERTLEKFAVQPDGDAILATVVALNEQLNTNEVYVTDVTDSHAFIFTKPGSQIYAQGSVEIIYTVEKRVKLSEVVTKRDLGEITNAFSLSYEELKNKIFDLNPKLNKDEVVINFTGNGQLALLVKANSAVYFDKEDEQVIITYQDLFDISTAQETDLGEVFVDNYYEPKTKEILDAFRRSNHGYFIDETDIKVSYIYDKQDGQKIYQAIISPIEGNDKVVGTITVSFKPTANIPFYLNKATVTDLGTLEVLDLQAEISDEQLLTLFIEKNPEFRDLIIDEVEITFNSTSSTDENEISLQIKSNGTNKNFVGQTPFLKLKLVQLIVEE